MNSTSPVSSSRRIRPMIIAVVVILIAMAILILLETQVFAKSQCNGVSGGSIYKTSARAIKEKDTKTLAEISVTIKEQKNYTKDASCQVALFYDSLYREQYATANRYLETIRNLSVRQQKLVDDYKSIGVNSILDAEKALIESETQKSENLNEIYF